MSQWDVSTWKKMHADMGSTCKLQRQWPWIVIFSPHRYNGKTLKGTFIQGSVVYVVKCQNIAFCWQFILHVANIQHRLTITLGRAQM